MEHFKAQAQQLYEELIALGGRPTRPFPSPLVSNVPAVGGRLDYREETEKDDMITNVDLTLDGDGHGYAYWMEESSKWDEELLEWMKFKRIQQYKSQFRSELDLELDNTDVGLVEILSKLKDWQDYHLIKQRDVYDAEIVREKCHERITRSRNATGVTSDPNYDQENRVPFEKLMSEMEESQKSLETCQKNLLWVESQWTEVLAEASQSISGEPKLQKELEDKFEKQANAIYCRLQRLGAKSRPALHPPNESATLAQRLQYLISETSKLSAEAWDWKVLMAWRQPVENTTTTKEEAQKQSAPSESCAELFEDVVKYRQYKLDELFGWMACWRSLARQYTAGRKRKLGWTDLQTLRGNNDDDDDNDDKDEKMYHNAHGDVEKAEKACFYAQQAELMVPKAAERLERAKQELQNNLAQSGQPPTSTSPAEKSGTQLPPTPPASQSSESLPDTRRSSDKTNIAEKGDRRLKKQRYRKKGAEMGKTNIEQQPLPTFQPSPSSAEEAEDVDMSDVSEDSSPAETAEDFKETGDDTVMSDIEDPPNLTPPSSSESHPSPTTNTKSKAYFSSTTQTATSRRKTRSAAKLNRVISGGVPKKITEKNANFTKQQTMALLDATNSHNPTAPITPRRSERLKAKAEFSTAGSPLILPPTSSPPSNTDGSSPSSNQKKRKAQSDILEPPETSRQKKRKLQSESLESPESSRQKKRIKI